MSCPWWPSVWCAPLEWRLPHDLPVVLLYISVLLQNLQQNLLSYTTGLSQSDSILRCWVSSRMLPGYLWQMAPSIEAALFQAIHGCCEMKLPHWLCPTLPRAVGSRIELLLPARLSAWMFFTTLLETFGIIWRSAFFSFRLFSQPFLVYLSSPLLHSPHPLPLSSTVTGTRLFWPVAAQLLWKHPAIFDSSWSHSGFLTWDQCFGFTSVHLCAQPLCSEVKLLIKLL